MKAVRKGLAVLLAVLLVLPGSPMSVERILVAEAAEADKEQETAIGAEMTGPEAGETVDGDELTDEDLAGGAVDAEDGATSLGTTKDENSDAQMESPSSDSADGGSDESEKETGDVTDSALDDEVTEKPSAAEDEEGSPEMPDDALEDLEEMPVDGSEEEDKSEDGNEVQSDGDTVQTDGSSSEEDGLDTETESGQPLVEDLPVVYAENIVASGADGDLTWSLDSDGVLTVSGTGDYSTNLDVNSNLWADYRNSITSARVEVTGMTRMDRMFSDCGNLTSVDLSGFDSSNVTLMWGMFSGCSSLKCLDLSGFETGKVTDMWGMFSGCSSLTSLDLSGFDTSNVTSMFGMFSGCSSLTSLDVGGFDTSNVTEMECMFSGCSSLTNLDLSSFDTSKVTGMGDMFSSCHSLVNLDLTSFDTGNVTGMRNMFSNCESLLHLDLGSFDTGNVTDMAAMFDSCRNLESLNLTSFKTNNVTDMNSMFSLCNNLRSLEVGSFDTGNVTDMVGMFSDCSNLISLDLGSFDTGNVTDMRMMFSGCRNLASLDLSSFNISNVAVDMVEMFSGCDSLATLYTPKVIGWQTISLPAIYSDAAGNLTQELTESYANMVLKKEGTEFGFVDGTNEMVRWIYDADTMTTVITGRGRRTVTVVHQQSSLPMDTEHVRFVNCEIEGSLGSLFSDLTNLKSIDFSNLTMTNSTDYNAMFSGCSSLTELDLSGFDTSNTKSMSWMFNGCSSLTSLDLSSFNTSNVISTDGMFRNCSSLISLDLISYDTSNTTNMNSMFMGCKSLVSVDLGSFDTSNVTNMNSMFRDCKNLSGLDLSGFDTSNVTDMEFMFGGCESLSSLNLSSLSTGNVVNMNHMFSNCKSLPSLDLSGFDTSNVMKLEYMFAYCENLRNLNLITFNTDNVMSMKCMFVGCSNLENLDLSSFNTRNVANMYGMFWSCKSLTSLDLSSFDTSNVTDMGFMFLACGSLISLDLSSFNTSNVTDMRLMFDMCQGMTSLDLGSFDTSNVTDMQFMFAACSNLQSLKLDNFDTSNVTSMRGMFTFCNFSTIDLSSFDTGNVTDMSEMFSGSGLSSLDLSGFNMGNVTNVEKMLSDCNKMTAIQTPRNLTQSIALPAIANTAWHLPDDTEITQLPLNMSESVLIERRDTGTTEPADIWFHVTGAVGHSQYSDIYIAENTSQNILDTLFDPLYENHYQTLFINDRNTDLASLIPTFEVSANMEVLSPGGRLTSGQTVQDFSKGSIIYRLASSAKSSAMPGPATSPKTDWGYTVTFVKKESGPKLFVNGPAEREIFLTDYFQNQHDILIANLGDTQLTGIHAELLDAVNVKLDDSHPVESALAAFDRVPGQGQEASDVMANLGKVRLVPDGEGEISGTLKITADGQEPVYIVLTGYSSNPRITTTSTELNMDDVIRVKYVPYSYTVETNNEYEWNKVTFAVVEGELARGLEMYPATGEIYGVPLEAGEFSITVKATFSRPEFLPSYAQLTLIVKDNTDGNVSVATDPGYDLVQRVQDIALDTWAGGSQTMVSLGDYAEFRAVYLDGERLVEGEDYDSEAGSTRITVQNQTLADKGAGSHTLGIEFRTSDKEDLRRAAQNYTVAQAGNQTGNGGSGNGGSNFGGGFSSGTDDLYMIDAEVSEAIIYTVQPGDSLWSIAFRFYGTGAFWRRIYEDNMTVIQNPNRIYPGQKLVIRLADSDRAGDALTGAKGRIYTVMMGENLWTIAKKVYGNGMLWERIYQANRELIFNPRRIYAGQRIVIPVVE